MTSVTTTAGRVRGRRHGDGLVFSGIPYAAAPVGPARFAAPRPAPRWDGERDATRPGPTAPSPERAFGALDMVPFFGPGWVRGEDYLTVTVSTPDTATRGLPVMVFVHGGGFVSGSAQAALYDGAGFSRDGVVLVALNYRLGAPGWLALPGAPDNRGLLDVLAALRWVQEEIEAFGGDPGNVTLFGQSAGATIVDAALAEHADSGLFRRVISQSGNGLGAFVPAQAELVAHRLGAVLDMPVAELAEVPDERLLAATAGLRGLDLAVDGRPDPLLRLSPFGLVLRRQPATSVAAGAGAEIDLLIGNNTEEGNLYLAPGGDLDESTMDDVRSVAARAHPDPDRLVAAYRAQRPAAAAGELRSAVLGDALFGAGTRALADAHSAHAAATYRYEFAWRSSALGGSLGAAHGVELPFVFDIAGEPGLHGPNALLGTEHPSELGAEVHAAWVRFATSGDPGWERHTTPRRPVRRFGRPPEVVADPNPLERAAW
ncbi:carboxylesterase family protein [Saccharopolyspora sp. NFXS83]|uniref:carboxylesterase/lipase family protein n=1 Tax=Saccharopolyspora sp. NFXS83 TaxID=2993560 RepID=UPI00224AAEA3|nr:carboxylesterase family protein [Saccharopolyspora sp. NFXS83]MCX2731031.1 carboxylesterase family protein [Saccharopolyspora sp. NFXS83]